MTIHFYYIQVNKQHLALLSFAGKVGYVVWGHFFTQLKSL